MENRVLGKKLFIFNSNVSDGNMSYKYASNKEIVNANKKKFYELLKINEENIYNLHVTFSDKISIIDSKPINKEIVADSIITGLDNFFITLGFADCIPLIIYDQVNDFFSFSHLGWQSICVDLHKKIVQKMIKDMHSNLSDLILYIGPSIKVKSYAFENPSQLSMSNWSSYLTYMNGLYHVDLTKYVVDNILDLGVSRKNIIISSVDTGNNNEYFSHYRSMHDKFYTEGRFLLGAGKLEHI